MKAKEARGAGLMDASLRRMTEEGLRGLIERQMLHRTYLVNEITEYDGLIRESLGEFMRRCDAGEIVRKQNAPEEQT